MPSFNLQHVSKFFVWFYRSVGSHIYLRAMEFGPIAVFLVSLVPLPLCTFLNSQRWMLQSHIILVVGMVVLALLVLGPYLAIRRMKNPDFMLAGSALNTHHPMTQTITLHIVNTHSLVTAYTSLFL